MAAMTDEEYARLLQQQFDRESRDLEAQERLDREMAERMQRGQSGDGGRASQDSPSGVDEDVKVTGEEKEGHELRKRGRQEESESSDVAESGDGDKSKKTPSKSPEKRQKKTDGAKRESGSASSHYLFKLASVEGIPASKLGKERTVSLPELLEIEGDEVDYIVLSNYMYDMEWLLSACPILEAVPVKVIYGDRDNKHLRPYFSVPNLRFHKPDLPIPFGTHHSKAILLFGSSKMRLVICTGNFIERDWSGKTQGIWYQDFPLKEKGTRPSEFEDDLVRYFTAVGGFQVTDLKKYDFSSAEVKLVAGIPGQFEGSDANHWGLRRLKKLLQDYKLPKKTKLSLDKSTDILMQFSSLGSLTQEWLNNEFLTTALTVKSKKLKKGKARLVFPTVEQVRTSVQGYLAGDALPARSNCWKDFLIPLLHRYEGEISGRERAMPHIKLFCAHQDKTPLWVLLSSFNLSRAAFGETLKNGKFRIRSYELGVLFLPKADGEDIRTLETNVRSDSTGPIAPIPFSLQPQPFGSKDEVWRSDGEYTKPDDFGETYPLSFL